MEILTGWTDAHSAKFRKKIFTFQHKLEQTNLFSDEALIALLDNHPHDLLDVRTLSNGGDPRFPMQLRSGDFRDCSGADLLAAAKAGWIWINMRDAMKIYPRYKKVMKSMYKSLAKKTGVTIHNEKGGILITSPVARTPFHFDKTETILWHVRGQKRVFVYPQEQDFIADETFEQTLLAPITDDLPFESEFEDKAVIYDLKEGEAITWPLNSPHRVENNSFCVSVTTEYSTYESSMKNGAMVTNGVLRSVFGRSSLYHQQTLLNRYVRSLFGRIVRKLGLVGRIDNIDMISFRLDPSVPSFIVDIEPFERNF